MAGLVARTPIKPKKGNINNMQRQTEIITDDDVVMAEFVEYATSQDCHQCGGSPDEEEFGNILEHWHDDCARTALREVFDV